MFSLQARAPSRRTLKRRIKILSKEVKDKIKVSLKGARRVSSTIDIWSSKKCKNSYFGMTCHLLNPTTRKRESYRVSCRVMDCPHTAFNIAVFLRNIFSEYEIRGKVFRVLSDNASSMIKAFRDVDDLVDEDEVENETESDTDDSEDEGGDEDSEPEDITEDTEVADVDNQVERMEREEAEHGSTFIQENIKRNPCVVHKLQLPIQKVISEKKTSFGKMLRKCRLLVKKYNKSSKARALLRKFGFKYVLVGFCKTRWWSDVDMVEKVKSALETEGNPIMKMCDKMGWNIEFIGSDQVTMEEYLDIMKPFRSFGDRLGGEESSTVHLIYPVIRELISHLEQKMRDRVQRTFCNKLLKEIQKYFDYLLDPLAKSFDPFYVAATYLDPFYKGVLDNEMKKEAKRCIIDVVKEETSKISEDSTTEDVLETVAEVVVPDELLPEEEDDNFELPGLQITSGRSIGGSSDGGPLVDEDVVKVETS